MNREQQKVLLHKAVSAVSASVVDEFERQFASWKKTWGGEDLAHLSDPYCVTRNKEFGALKAMGSEILPLVVQKLAVQDNFFALQLYEAVEKDADMVVVVDPGDDAILEGEQGRARRTVERWISRLQPEYVNKMIEKDRTPRMVQGGGPTP